MLLVTLVATLCSGAVCVDKVVTNSDISGITESVCKKHGQISIAFWLSQNPGYAGWQLKGYRCDLGKFEPKRDV